MNKICFDARMTGYTGIGTYIKNLLNEFCRLGFLEFVSVYGDRNDAYFKNHPKIRVVHTRAGVYSVSEQLYFCLESLKNKKIFHSPHYNAPFLTRGRLVTTIHDLTHIKNPEYLPSKKALAYARFMLNSASRRSSAIITSSESVKSDIIGMLKTPEDKITVIPLAAGGEFCPVQDQSRIEQFKNKYSLPEKFILYTGNMKKHKNLDVVLSAFRNLREKNRIEAGLVFAAAGRPDRSLELKSREWGLGDVVRFLPFIEDHEMPLMYNCADLFVFPSISEGFGLPVLEAMACGVPCVASNSSSLPEVAGSAAILCDPDSVSEFEKAIRDIFDNRSLRDFYSKKGLERAAGFSWEKTAGETINVYNRCSGDFL